MLVLIIFIIIQSNKVKGSSTVKILSHAPSADAWSGLPGQIHSPFSLPTLPTQEDSICPVQMLQRKWSLPSVLLLYPFLAVFLFSRATSSLAQHSLPALSPPEYVWTAVWPIIYYLHSSANSQMPTCIGMCHTPCVCWSCLLRNPETGRSITHMTFLINNNTKYTFTFTRDWDGWMDRWTDKWKMDR